MNKGNDFSGFRNEGKGIMKRLVIIEREMRFMKEVLEGIIIKYEALK